MRRRPVRRLIEQMGGKPTPGLGFGLGMERLMLILQAQGIELPEDKPCEIFLVSMGERLPAGRLPFATSCIVAA